ncbi:MAG: hypothetical protein HUJ30_03730 [Gammaproteobacteria bacterium]|nr:hypothetical protein [Gammaproteobacteria bacterium]
MEVDKLARSPLQQALSTTESASTRPAVTHASPEPPTDELNISPQAQLLHELEQGGIEWGRSFKTIPPIPRSLTEILESLQQQREAVQAKIEGIFALADPGLEEEITIQSDHTTTTATAASSDGQQRAQAVIDDHPIIQTLLTSIGQQEDLTLALQQGGELNRAGDDPQQRANIEQQISQHFSSRTETTLTIQPSRPADSLAG